MVFRIPASFVRSRRLQFALLFVVGLMLISCGGNDRLVVSTAASIGDAVSEIAVEFEKSESIHVALNLSGSNALASQVDVGAPVDVVLFAGSGPMNRLLASGNVEPKSVEKIVENRLAVIGRSGAEAGSFPELLTSIGGKIAIADPGLAPAGSYAEEAMRSADVYEAVESRLLPTLDVRAAAAAVQSGGADLGIVYVTDAMAVDAVNILTMIPPESHSPIIYPAAVVAGSSQQELSSRFVAFLRSGFAKSVFERHGFVPVDR